MRSPLLLAPFALAACVTAEPDVSAEAGQALFQANCAACHGTDARGAEGAGTELLVASPDLTTLSARNGGIYPRDYVLSTIDGYRRGDRFAHAMPEFGAMDLGPTIIVEEDGIGTPIPAQLLALSTWLESVQE